MLELYVMHIEIILLIDVSSVPVSAHGAETVCEHPDFFIFPAALNYIRRYPARFAQNFENAPSARGYFFRRNFFHRERTRRKFRMFHAQPAAQIAAGVGVLIVKPHFKTARGSLLHREFYVFKKYVRPVCLTAYPVSYMKEKCRNAVFTHYV